MIAASILLSLLAAGTPQGPISASLDSARAFMVAERPEVELGAPFELHIEVEHDAGTLVRLGDLPWTAASGWLLFERGLVTAQERGDGGGLVTSVRFRIAAIEQAQVETEDGWAWSAEREIPAPPILLVEGPVESELFCEPATIRAISLLAADQDVPRGFPAIPEANGGLSQLERWERAGVVGVLAAGVLVWSWFVLLRSRSTGAVAVVEPSVSERRRALDARLREGVPPRDLLFELTALARDAVDGRLAFSRRGMTDGEWLDAFPTDAPFGELRGSLTTFLEGASRAKYSGDEATSWAIEELAREANAVLEAVDRIPQAAVEALAEAGEKMAEGAA